MPIDASSNPYGGGLDPDARPGRQGRGERSRRRRRRQGPRGTGRGPTATWVAGKGAGTDAFEIDEDVDKAGGGAKGFDDELDDIDTLDLDDVGDPTAGSGLGDIADEPDAVLGKSGGLDVDDDDLDVAGKDDDIDLDL